MRYVVDPAPVVSIPVHGSASLFPVRRLYCVGRNYAAHIREMGLNPEREAPFFFCKPADAVAVMFPDRVSAVRYPSQTANYHHEVELVVAIGVAGADILPGDAEAHIWGYGVGLDMTRRDLQFKMRDAGRPWEIGKAFDGSAPLAPLRAAAQIGHPKQAAIWLAVDGEERQRSDISQLIWSVPEIVANLSSFFRLEAGDIIFTGTPDGVGPVERGQVMRGGIDGLGEFQVRVT